MVTAAQAPAAIFLLLLFGLTAVRPLLDVMLLEIQDMESIPQEDDDSMVTVSLIDFTPCFEWILAYPINTSTRYEERKRLGEGFFGKAKLVVPHCTNICPKPNLVLKEAKVWANSESYRAAIREEYFGKIFRRIPKIVPGSKNLARMVETIRGSNEFYTVSMFEGITLHSALYKSSKPGNEPYQWWKWLKKTPEGNTAMRDIMKQMISGLALLHRYNITHRDLKPDNIVICFYTPWGDCIGKPTIELAYHGLHLRLIDFGSGLDEYSQAHLYGRFGPTTGTQDDNYMSPECFYRADCLTTSKANLAKYDMFTVGQIFMEMILRTQDVFGYEDDLFGKKRFLDMCVEGVKLALPPHCNSEKSFLKYIRERDPLKIGFPGIRGLRFAQQLLHHDIDKRLSAEKALRHPYLN
ncbi:hypothetical protein ACH5RR_020119 [Cinchona calisaya]|uniref:Protein kinase domain-containing protein n=1 Tax=Cinchona calisaya TaxID=153742 RepID=A0ABD2ZGZ2_9GENT